MNIIFLTLVDINSIEDHGIYQDLLREFLANGHEVFVVSPAERRKNQETEYYQNGHYHSLKVRIGNIQKTNLIEKGCSMLTLEFCYKRAIKKFLSDTKFDLILYSTPPITFAGVIRYLKERDGAFCYLLLKDIFPQNAVDLKIFSKFGLFYAFFRRKEQELYRLSDCIGCMSENNRSYLLAHNKWIPENIVEITPNAMTMETVRLSQAEIRTIRQKYEIPFDKKVFVYGGNLGRPQNIDFIISCLKSVGDNHDIFILIVGSGTDFRKLNQFYQENNNRNFKVMQSLPRQEFERLTAACDFGLIFLDYRFTIPNYPSRLLTYLKTGLPVLSLTDCASDIGDFIENNHIGVKEYSNSLSNFIRGIQRIMLENIPKDRIYHVLAENFDVKYNYKNISERYYENRCK